MKPRGALMIEHRLIEKVLAVLKKRVAGLNEKNFDPLLTDVIVDFIRTYADRTHHGKEEDILFKILKGKNMKSADIALMDELVDDHRLAREKVRELVEFNTAFKKGEKGNLKGISEIFQWLIEFYPIHIRKEDDIFFPITEKYFDKDELDKLLDDFWEFDRKMIHEKYIKVYESLTEGGLKTVWRI